MTPESPGCARHNWRPVVSGTQPSRPRVRVRWSLQLCLPNVAGLSSAGRATRDPRLLKSRVSAPGVVIVASRNCAGLTTREAPVILLEAVPLPPTFGATFLRMGHHSDGVG